MARNKKRKTSKAQKPKLKPIAFIRKFARTFPFGECFIANDWKESGLATIFVSRLTKSGRYLPCFFVVDLFCLGLKDTGLIRFTDRAGYLERVEDMESRLGLFYIECDPILAQNIIYGAIEYAEDLGFKPQKDFKKTVYLLDDVEEIEYMDIEFGKDGKPLYVSGPFDNTREILNKLERAVGVSNFSLEEKNGLF